MIDTVEKANAALVTSGYIQIHRQQRDESYVSDTFTIVEHYRETPVLVHCSCFETVSTCAKFKNSTYLLPETDIDTPCWFWYPMMGRHLGDRSVWYNKKEDEACFMEIAGIEDEFGIWQYIKDWAYFQQIKNLGTKRKQEDLKSECVEAINPAEIKERERLATFIVWARWTDDLEAMQRTERVFTAEEYLQYIGIHLCIWIRAWKTEQKIKEMCKLGLRFHEGTVLSLVDFSLDLLQKVGLSSLKMSPAFPSWRDKELYDKWRKRKENEQFKVDGTRWKPQLIG